MTKVLIISDNEVLNQLYKINLDVYLAAEVIIVDGPNEAKDLIQKHSNFDLIISLNMIQGKDSAFDIYQFLKEKNLNLPLLVIGTPSNKIPNAETIQVSYHLQTFLRTCATILKIDSKTMSAMLVEDFFEIELKFLMRLNLSPCPIYLKIINNKNEATYTLVVKKDTKTPRIYKIFLTENITTVFVKRKDRLLAVNMISEIICELLQDAEHADLEKKSIALEAGFHFIVSDFCHSPEGVQAIIEIAESCLKLMENISKEVSGLSALMDLFYKNKDEFLYIHSILASYTARHIVKTIKWGGESHVDKINFVLLFHDIKLAPIYTKYPKLKSEDDLLASNELGHKEKELVINHAKLAAELFASNHKVPSGVDLIIKQHHGMLSGTGFASEFTDDISPLAKIVIISEAFVEDFLKCKNLNPDYKLILNEKILLLLKKFPLNSYQVIIKTLETLKL